MNVLVSKFCCSKFKHFQNGIPATSSPSTIPNHLDDGLGLLAGLPASQSLFPTHSQRDAIKIKVSSCSSFVQNLLMAPDSFRVKVKGFTVTPKVLHTLTLLSDPSLPLPFPPLDLCSSNTSLVPVPPACQTFSHLKAFALAAPSDWDSLHPGTCMVSPSPTSCLCSNIIFSGRPALTTLFKMATPLFPLS